MSDRQDPARRLVVRGADELLRLILEAEQRAKGVPASASETIYINVAGRVAAWARRVGSPDDVQRFSGNPTTDLPRLKAFVQEQLERWREEHEPPASGATAAPRIGLRISTNPPDEQDRAASSRGRDGSTHRLRAIRIAATSSQARVTSKPKKPKDTPATTVEKTPTNNAKKAPDPKKVMVVHGRDKRATEAMFDLLERLHLKPQEWGKLVESTGTGSPFIGDVLDVAFQEAQAVVVLLTPDDEARLREELHAKNESDSEKALMGQARPNVLFEAGMALGVNPKRTILVEVGSLRPFSDIDGRHVVRINSSQPEPLREIARRLKTAGCDLDDSGERWLQTKFPVRRRRSSNKRAEGAAGAERKKLMKAAAAAVTNALRAFSQRKAATPENVTERGEAFDARVHDVALLAIQVNIEFTSRHPATRAYQKAHARLETLKDQVYAAEATVLDANLGQNEVTSVREALDEFLSRGQQEPG